MSCLTCKILYTHTHTHIGKLKQTKIDVQQHICMALALRYLKVSNFEGLSFYPTYLDYRHPIIKLKRISNKNI